MTTGKAWEERLREASTQLEEELRRAVRYVDEEVVPEVRRGGSAALKTASEQLRRLAERLDDESRKRDGGAK